MKRSAFLASLFAIPAAVVAAVTKDPKPEARFRKVAEIPANAGDVVAMCVLNGNVVIACKNSVWLYPIEEMTKK